MARHPALTNPGDLKNVPHPDQMGCGKMATKWRTELEAFGLLVKCPSVFQPGNSETD